MPGLKDPRGVKKAIGTTGQVEYRLVDDQYSRLATQWLQQNFKEQQLPEEKEKLDALLSDLSRGIALPATLEALYYYVRDNDSKKIVPSYPIVLVKKVSIAGRDIS
jgi:hypothetical protein